MEAEQGGGTEESSILPVELFSGRAINMGDASAVQVDGGGGPGASAIDALGPLFKLTEVHLWCASLPPSLPWLLWVFLRNSVSFNGGFFFPLLPMNSTGRMSPLRHESLGRSLRAASASFPLELDFLILFFFCPFYILKTGSSSLFSAD